MRQRPRPIPPLDYVPGDDVSGWQTDVNWSDAASKGARFVYIKATEDDDYVSPQYETQWKGAQDTGFYRGSYHFGRPFWSDGTSQAKHFMNTIHNWKPTQRILPPMLDLEHRCSDLKKPWAIKKCKAMTPKDVVKWIYEFVSVVEKRTGGVKPVIYTNPSWWKKYTGNTTKFSSYPLFIAKWVSDVSDGPGALPGGWKHWTLWQHWNDVSPYAGPGDLMPGDQDFFRGTRLALKRFSNNVHW
ncbi:lysozyme [Leifsonia xyli subsp. xyli str. CTCB07]|uniref:Lysozyme n=1 Tax=Leifsonia xyli subsp. xyli (strain CTCB07) TaxID=281090 RepID=Q6ACF3_LEIXX|nr:lysozyme [Leifsonia xyli subsp. xyli str. CTCB07]